MGQKVPLCVYRDANGKLGNGPGPGMERIAIGTAEVDLATGRVSASLDPTGPYATLGSIHGSFSIETEVPTVTIKE
jgi:hypothetical protein